MKKSLTTISMLGSFSVFSKGISSSELNLIAMYFSSYSSDLLVTDLLRALILLSICFKCFYYAFVFISGNGGKCLF